MPRPIYDNGERLPATYANFVILNGAVIVPTYQQPDIDAKALEVVGMAFENREIVGNRRHDRDSAAWLATLSDHAISTRHTQRRGTGLIAARAST